MPYQIVILHEGHPELAKAFESQIRQALIDVSPAANLDRTGDIEAAAASDDPTLVVCLVDRAAQISAGIARALDLARAEAYPVLPVLLPGASPRDTPEPIRRLNAIPFDDTRLPMAALRMLGASVPDRRLFLSYRRTETTPIALQLRRALSEHGFDVFLDRFSVPPGADFQQRIDVELSDKAFVVLLESQSAVGSEWVQHEVVYALGHHIGILALTMPGTTTQHQFEVIDEAFRLRLTNDEIDPSSSELTNAALANVLSTIERRHAREIRRRRLQLLGTANDFLLRAGFEVVPMASWTTLGTRGDERVVVHVVPSVPTPPQLREADRARQIEGGHAVEKAFVVHNTYDPDPESRSVLDWIVADRPLEVVSIPNLPEALSR